MKNSVRLSRGLLASLCMYLLSATVTQAFDLQNVADKARALADKPYAAPGKDAVPNALTELSYDQYRDIRFKPEASIWRNRKLNFELQLFHPGHRFNHPVRINLVTADGVNRVPFKPDSFDYGHLNPDLETEKLGDIDYAGLRVHYNLNSKEYKDEVLVFRGASYFRALGKDQHYGLSARALAVDTGELSGEEFPEFKEFWIAWPSQDDKHLVIYALLDSRRMTGAYRFELKPGETTRMDVQSRIFLREKVKKLGIAPLTSMYLFGENQPASHDDYRPEVHDSDGLMVHAGNGEWIWRPLRNPQRLAVTSFATENPAGFGLMQRDRKWSNYEDLEARYERRPSAWVTPDGKWGKGRVELVMIPTPDETNDNIVAYWVPADSLSPGKAYDFNYSLQWQMKDETSPPSAATQQSRRGHGWQKEPDDSLRMVIDFDGPALKALEDDAKLSALVTLDDNGKLLEQQVFPNSVTGGWRLSFRYQHLDPEKPLEMRAVLKSGQEVVTETWSYLRSP